MHCVGSLGEQCGRTPVPRHPIQGPVSCREDDRGAVGKPVETLFDLCARKCASICVTISIGTERQDKGE